MRLDHKPKWSSIEHMNRARAAKPASGGKVYKQGRIAKRVSGVAARATWPKRGSWAALVGDVKADWASDWRDARDQYERTVFPERFEVEVF